MKVRLRWLLVMVLSLLVTKAQAASADKSAATARSTKPTAALELAQTVSAVTGIAISPLLGVGAVGCYQYVKAPAAERGTLSWYAQPWFFIPALLLVGLVAAKDVLGAATPPGLKKPIDAAETLENKVSGLVATGAIVPMIGTFLKAAGPQAGLDIGPLHLAAIDLTPLLQIAATPFALAAYAVVWLAAHTVHVLILLSPWGVVDAVLKGIRTALLSALTGIALIDPWIGALLSAVLIVIAYFIAGWSFRLSVYGSVFCWDFFSLRRLRFKPSPAGNWTFAARAMGEVPIRTYGLLRRTPEGRLEFAYRPWLVLPEKTHVVGGGGHAVGRALLHPTLEVATGDSHLSLFNFPPRCRGHEEELGRAYAVPVLDVGLLGGLKAVGFWLRELLGLGGRSAPAS